MTELSETRPRPWPLPILVLSLGAATAGCGQRPVLGVEAVLARTGLSEALLEKAKSDLGTNVSVVIGEDKELLEKLKKGELDLLVTNDDLVADALLREGKVASAEPLLHGETVLVGPDKDPAGLHAERNLANALRAIIETEAAFFRCGPCGTTAREEAIFAALPDLPKGKASFLDVGKGEEDVLRALQGSPGYAFLSRPTVIERLRNKEWSFKPVWSGDALQADTYRLFLRPVAELDSARKDTIQSLARWLAGDAAKKIIETYGQDKNGQPFYKPGAPRVGEGVKF